MSAYVTRSSLVSLRYPSTANKVIYHAVVIFLSPLPSYTEFPSRGGRYRRNQEKCAGETFDYEQLVWRHWHSYRWCISLLLISYYLGSLRSVPERTPAENNEVIRTFKFASESLIHNVVYNLMSSVLNEFLNEFTKDGDKIVIVTYYPEGSPGVAAPSDDVPITTTDMYSATYHFASILEVQLLFS